MKLKLGIERLECRDTPATLSILDTAVVEGHSGVQNMVFQVSLSEPVSNPVTVQFNTGSTSEASPGSDYRPRGGTLTFAPGETLKSFSVPIYGDTVGETDEQVVAKLQNARGATINDGTALGTIFNDDDTHGASMVLDSDGVLHITGTELADGVGIYQVGGNLYVGFIAHNADGSLAYQQTLTTPVAGVQRIVFHGNDGNDTFADYSSVFSEAYGEAGTDVLLADLAVQD